MSLFHEPEVEAGRCAMRNVDEKTVEGFGKEWSWCDQTPLSADELERQFAAYFSVFPWDRIPPDAEGFDAGCGSGRWAQKVAPRVGRLHCVDASAEALDVARKKLARLGNCAFHHASLADMPFSDGSMDFGYALGVLHHLPDTAAGIAACTRKLKLGAPFLVYIYYAFDSRPAWFRALWHVSDAMRGIICRLPGRTRLWVTWPIAAFVYWPLARVALLLERLGLGVEVIPLSAYRNKSFYSMRTDALDRFGTRLEKRFTADQIHRMMTEARLENIRFSDGVPYWCAVGFVAPRSK